MRAPKGYVQIRQAFERFPVYLYEGIALLDSSCSCFGADTDNGITHICEIDRASGTTLSMKKTADDFTGVPNAGSDRNRKQEKKAQVCETQARRRVSTFAHRGIYLQIIFVCRKQQRLLRNISS